MAGYQFSKILITHVCMFFKPTNGKWGRDCNAFWYFSKSSQFVFSSDLTQVRTRFTSHHKVETVNLVKIEGQIVIIIQSTDGGPELYGPPHEYSGSS